MTGIHLGPVVDHSYRSPLSPAGDWTVSCDDNFRTELDSATIAAQDALRIAQHYFRTSFQMAIKGTNGDLVTEVDLRCEKSIVARLRSQYPEHTIRVEELQDHVTDSPWSWVIDPLDGTNNYAFGLPTWGLSIALCHHGTPVLAAISDGPSGSLITARSGAGVMIDDSPYTPVTALQNKPSAALWLGYDVDRTAPATQQLLGTLARRMRRTFENWAPTVDVGLYLRGGIDLVVASNCSGTELPAVMLTLREAGATIVDSDGKPARLDALPELFFAGRAAAVRRLLADIRHAAGQRMTPAP
jgi:myo-inositol-1(or 4)-monophosphatase